MEFDAGYPRRNRNPRYTPDRAPPPGYLPSGRVQQRIGYQERSQRPELYSHHVRRQNPLAPTAGQRRYETYEIPYLPGLPARYGSPPPHRRRRSWDDDTDDNYDKRIHRSRSRSISRHRRRATQRETRVEDDSKRTRQELTRTQRDDRRSAPQDVLDLTRPLGEAPEPSASVPQPYLAYGRPETDDNGNQVVIVENVSTRNKRSFPVVEENIGTTNAEASRIAQFPDDVPVVEAVANETVGDQVADLATYENFNFIFPRRSPVADSSRDMDTSDSEFPENEDAQTSPRGSSQTLPSGRIERIFSSSYEGNYEIGASHNVILTEMHDPKEQAEPLFRWLHIQQTMMNFNDLWTDVSRLSHFSERERTALSQVRAELTKTCVRTRHNFKGDEVGYVEPRAFEVPIPPITEKSSAQPKYGATVKWICLPYFTLQGDGGLMSASSSAAFPSQTLSQAQFSRSDPQRDTEQAVMQLGLGKKGEVFHIAQLWCIVVQNSALITCGTMKLSDLQGNVIKFGSVPSPKPSLTTSSGRVLVSYGPEVIWSVNASDCTTWFSFASRFTKAWWPTIIKFTLRGREVTAKEWPKIMHLAGKPKAKVTLCLEKAIGLPPFTRGCLLYNSSTLGPSKKDKSGHLNDLDDDPEYLHIMRLHSVDSGRSSKSPQVSCEALRVQLAAAELYLTEETAYTTRRVYSLAPEADREEIYVALKDLEGRVNANPVQESQNAFETRIDIVNSSEILYRNFFPGEFEGPTTRKFWGAIKSLLVLPHPSTTHTDAFSEHFYEQLCEYLRTIVERIPIFQSIFAYSSDEDRARMTLPQELAKTWLHVVIGMIFAARGNGAWRPHLADVEHSLEQGMQKMMEDLPAPSLIESAAMLPMEVLALSMAELLRDQVGKSDDILETYSEYLNALDNDITSKPSDRAYQHSIDLAQQEMKSIRWNLSKQQWIISRVRNMIHPTESDDLVVRTHGRAAPARERAEFMEPPPYYDDERHDRYGDLKDDDGMFYIGFDNRFADEMASASKLSPTDPGGFRGLFLLECARLVEQREYEFKRFTEYAEELERVVAYKMDWTKDRQENAIYAFTLVTIIFLPLSAISSIFGMNTTDIRDMKQGQWLYWAVALPVTLLVIVIGLWWMNELDNLLGWAVGKQTSRVNPSYATAAATRPVDNWYLTAESRQADGNVGYDGVVSAPPPQSPAYDVSTARPSYRFRQGRRDTNFSSLRRRRSRY